MGRLLEAFPNAQFIIATHSPFMVSSVRDSFVYVLGYNPNDVVNESGINSRVSSLKLDAANKAGTASEILRDVLGCQSLCLSGPRVTFAKLRANLKYRCSPLMRLRA